MADSSDDTVTTDLCILAAITIIRRRRRRREEVKRLWVRPWLSRRDEFGAYDTLMRELEEEDVPGYISFQRMHPHLFFELLAKDKVSPLISKQDTTMRLAIPAAVRLAVTLRYLATGKYHFAIQNARFAIHNKLVHSKIANHRTISADI